MKSPNNNSSIDRIIIPAHNFALLALPIEVDINRFRFISKFWRMQVDSNMSPFIWCSKMLIKSEIFSVNTKPEERRKKFSLKTFLKDISHFCRAADTRFGLLVMSALGFKARVDSLFCTWQRHTCDTYSITLPASWQPAEPFSSMYLWAGIGGAQKFFFRVFTIFEYNLDELI